MNKTAYKLSLVFFITATLVGILTDVVYACTPAPETPWFNEKLDFLETNLPTTVEFLSDKQNITLINHKASSFYFYDDIQGDKDLGNKISIDIDIGEEGAFDSIRINDSFFSGFEHRNKTEDNRPNNIAPPAPQDVAIPITLDGKSYAIKLRISYEINNQYTPDSVELYEHACTYSPFLYLPPILSTSIIVGIILFVLAVIVLIRKSKS